MQKSCLLYTSCDEIESYNDSPAELIYDEFENIIFKGSPLGHKILGTAEQVRSFKTEDALRFTRKLYRPDNAIFFACLLYTSHLQPESLAVDFRIDDSAVQRTEATERIT